VVRVKVVADVRVLPSPGLEGLELAFRLRHVRIEVVKLSQRGLIQCTASGVCVRRVVALVVLDVDDDVVFS